MKNIFAAFALSVTFACTSQVPVPAARMIKVIAHRGGSAVAPEHTLTAFRRAALAGADVLELDVRLTQDDVLVALHDETVDRTTDGTGPVVNFTLAALKRLNAGFHFSLKDGTFPYRTKPLEVATLAEILDSFPKMNFDIEIKPLASRAPQLFCTLLREKKATERAVVVTADHPTIQEFRKACPEVKTSASRREAWIFLITQFLGVSRFLDPPYASLQVPPVSSGLSVVTPRFLKAAWALLPSREVYVWTIDTEDEMKSALALHVDGIITNDPEKLIAILKDTGARVP